MDSKTKILVLSFLLGYLLLTAIVVRAQVTLVDFSAISIEGAVELHWETASENDNAGFYINRSLQASSDFERISAFIPGRGDSQDRAVYTYVDEEVINGVNYWYKLESIDFNQNTEFYEPPISAIPGTLSTETPMSSQSLSSTSTPTFDTLTQTPTPSQSTSISTTRTLYPADTQTPRPTSTRLPTSTPNSINAIPTTITQSSSSGGSSTQLALTEETSAISTTVESATATFIPLPSLTLEYPTLAYAPDQSNNVKTSDESTASATRDADAVNWMASRGIYLISLILLIWLALIAWLLFYMRRVE
jgi:hypothetical protein